MQKVPLTCGSAGKGVCGLEGLGERFHQPSARPPSSAEIAHAGMTCTNSSAHVMADSLLVAVLVSRGNALQRNRSSRDTDTWYWDGCDVTQARREGEKWSGVDEGERCQPGDLTPKWHDVIGWKLGVELLGEASPGPHSGGDGAWGPRVADAAH